MLMEARDAPAFTASPKKYRFIIYSSPALNGNLRCRICLSKEAPIAFSTSGVPRFFKVTDLDPVMREPRLLIAHIRSTTTQLTIIVAHAVDSSKGKEIVKDWWTWFTVAVLQADIGYPMLLGIDSNQNPSDAVTEVSGGVTAFTPREIL